MIYIKSSMFIMQAMLVCLKKVRVIFIRATLASAGISCCRVCLSLCHTSRCSTATANRRITQTTPHDSPVTLVFCCQKSRQNPNRVTANGGAKCRCVRLNAGAVADSWRLSTRSVVNLVPSQVYYTDRSPYLFAARSPCCSASRGFVSDS